jgi:hypothetical protein
MVHLSLSLSPSLYLPLFLSLFLPPSLPLSHSLSHPLSLPLFFSLSLSLYLSLSLSPSLSLTGEFVYGAPCSPVRERGRKRERKHRKCGHAPCLSFPHSFCQSVSMHDYYINKIIDKLEEFKSGGERKKSFIELTKKKTFFNFHRHKNLKKRKQVWLLSFVLEKRLIWRYDFCYNDVWSNEVFPTKMISFVFVRKTFVQMTFVQMTFVQMTWINVFCLNDFCSNDIFSNDICSNDICSKGFCPRDL